MSADDILFSPIRPKPKVTDFLVRRNHLGYNSFDWKPVTRRAHDWASRHFNKQYEAARVKDGWLLNHSSHPGVVGPQADHHDFLKELRDGDFQFEVVA